MSPGFLQLLFLGFCLIGLTFLVRFLMGPFSPEILEQMRRHPFIHGVGACLSIFFLLVVFMFLNPTSWPPDWWERRAQRQKVLERVESIGGWIALQRDCDALLAQYRDGGFLWFRGSTNALPSSLAALRPVIILLVSPPARLNSKGIQEAAIVRIQLFGAHSTGARSTPYFGLEIVAGPGNMAYVPRLSDGGAPGNSYSGYRKVTERIFEIY